MNLFDMSIPEIPKKEFLLHNRVDMLSEEQKFWWDAMVRLSDVISLTMKDYVERTSGSYLPMLFTEFLERLYLVINANRLCGKEFVFDDFISIATFSISALKHIVSSPSTQIVKRAEKVHVSSLRQTSSRTMQWMAKRPGRSIQEKIAPQNKVMTNVTHFSTDTKENRESIYLYSVLHDIVRDRVQDTECLRCSFADTCGVPTKDIRDLLGLHAKIMHGDLADVRPEKQAIQNNKLMCDVNYKMVWDGVKQLSRIEDSIAENWTNLRERYLQMAYWVILSIIIHDTDTLIIDKYGTFTDNQGKLSFSVLNADAIANSIEIFPKSRPWEPLLLELNGSELSLFEGYPYEEILFFDLSTVDVKDGETYETHGPSTIEHTTSSSYAIEETIIPDWSDMNIPALPEDMMGIAEDDSEVLKDQFSTAYDQVSMSESPELSVSADSVTQQHQHYVGDTVLWGSFRQSSSIADSSAIEWLIVDINDDRAMLISKLAVDCRIINRSSKVTDWVHTDLCTWLNSSFMTDSFTETEILSLLPLPDDSSRFVTLISREEAERLLSDNKLKASMPTEYAISKGAMKNSEGYCPYWTRTLYTDKSTAEIISGGGKFRKLKYQANFVSVRPVIYVKTDSLK